MDRSGGRGNKHWEGLEALEGMAAGLYAESFNAVVTLINRSDTLNTFPLLLYQLFNEMTVLVVT